MTNIIPMTPDMQISPIVFTREDAHALHELFAMGSPVTPNQIVAMTGLPVKALIDGGVVKTLGQWGDTNYLYVGPSFPRLEE